MALFDDAAGRALSRVHGCQHLTKHVCVWLEDWHARVNFEKLPRRYQTTLKHPRVK
jgi:hypothetical protein